MHDHGYNVQQDDGKVAAVLRQTTDSSRKNQCYHHIWREHVRTTASFRLGLGCHPSAQEKQGSCKEWLCSRIRQDMYREVGRMSALSYSQNIHSSNPTAPNQCILPVARGGDHSALTKVKFRVILFGYK